MSSILLDFYIKLLNFHQKVDLMLFKRIFLLEFRYFHGMIGERNLQNLESDSE